MNHTASDLQLRLARKIVRAIHEGSLLEGDHLRENDLSEMFGVSRTPIRAALSFLTDLKLVEKRANRGFFVSASSSKCLSFLESSPKTDDEQIKEAIAKDWFDGKISKEVSEGEIRKKYGLGRLTTQRILNNLSEEGIVSRMAGYGWQFEPTLNSSKAHDESYDFRIIVETSGILCATFSYDTKAGKVQLEKHKEILQTSEADWNAADLFRLDADFHNFVAQCSNNRFIIQTVLHQNRLRRLLEYNSLLNTGRLIDSCKEHISILRSLTANNRERAASAMKKHLQKAKNAGPEFEIR